MYQNVFLVFLLSLAGASQVVLKSADEVFRTTSKPNSHTTLFDPSQTTLAMEVAKPLQHNNIVAESLLSCPSLTAAQQVIPRTVGVDYNQILSSAIPVSIQKAMLNDPNAAKSLAQEFSGNNEPDWYRHLPKEVKNYFANEEQPPMMTGIYKLGCSPTEASSMSLLAVSASNQAAKGHDQDLATRASQLSQQASSMSLMAASATRASDCRGYGSPHNSASGVSLRWTATASSIAALICLTFALWL